MVMSNELEKVEGSIKYELCSYCRMYTYDMEYGFECGIEG